MFENVTGFKKKINIKRHSMNESNKKTTTIVQYSGDHCT